MFDGFQQQSDQHSRKRFAVSTGVSAVICVLFAGGVLAMAARPREAPTKKPVKVTFYRALPKPEIKPPTPKPTSPPPKQKPRKEKRASRSGGRSVVPEKLPDQALAEADEGAFASSEISTDDILNTKVGGGVPEPPQPPQKGRDTPIYISDNAIPPRPQGGNRMPAYPEQQRKRGVENLVVFKVVIDKTGAVTQIRALKGDEPFLGIARAAVSTWRYNPATVDGEPRAVYRIIKIPFKLRG